MRFVPVWISSEAVTVQKFSIDRIYDHERKEERNGKELGSEGEEAEKLEEVNQCITSHRKALTAYASSPAEASISSFVIL